MSICVLKRLPTISVSRWLDRQNDRKKRRMYVFVMRGCAFECILLLCLCAGITLSNLPAILFSTHFKKSPNDHIIYILPIVTQFAVFLSALGFFPLLQANIFNHVISE